MVLLKVSLNYLKEKTRWNEAAILEALPLVKAEVDSIEGDEITVEVTGDRPDLLCRQGIARAINGFRARELGAPKLDLHATKNEVIVDDNVLPVRPVIVCALARGLTLRDADVAELMQVQEKLTLTHGRRRRKVAIGIHDAKAIKFPLRYAAYSGRELSFTPLGCDNGMQMNLDEILRDHSKGKEYAWTLQGFSRYPVITDANDAVVSFPPIINGTMTTVTDATSDLFLDVTGTDFDACNVALNILCQNYADDGARIESVTVHSRGAKLVCPDARPEKMILDARYCNKTLGLELTKKEIVNCLAKQRIDAEDADGGKSGGRNVAAFIPRYRADFLHQADLIEEVALGYGYNAFTPLKPRVFTRGSVNALTELSDKARDCLAGAGFVEFAGFVLTSEAKAARADSVERLIKIRNPVSEDYSALRASLLPGVLEVLSENTHRSYPQRLFEVGETIERDAGSDARSRTTLKACAVSAHAYASFSEAATALSILGKALNKELFLEKAEKAASRQFIEGRCARIVDSSASKEIGLVGELHPRVLSAYGLQVPAAAFEIRL